MFLRIKWQDPRLALTADQRTDKLRQFSLEQIWTPHDAIVNDRGLKFSVTACRYCR